MDEFNNPDESAGILPIHSGAPDTVPDSVCRQIIENVREVFWVTNADATQLLYISPAYSEIWGRSVQSLFEQPMSWLEAVLPEDRPQAEIAIHDAIEKGQCTVEFRIVRPDGDIRWIRDRSFPVRDEQGAIIRIAGIAEDITEWKRTEKELRTESEHHRLISDLTADYAYTSRIGPDGEAVIDSISEGFTRVTGYTLEELNQRGGWPALIHPDDLAETREVNSHLQENERLVGELRIVTKSGEIKWILYSSRLLRSTPGGPIDRVIGASQDVTERHMAKERLRELSHRLFDVQEQERRRLARELHDEVAQSLTALMFYLEAAASPILAEARRGIDQSRQLVKELAGQVRNMSLQLRPTMLDDLGLVPALLWLFNRFGTRPGLRIDFEHHGLTRRLGPTLETAAYRIVQEALTNVARHAKVANATVRAWIVADRLHLTIEDAGVGFDVASAMAGSTSAGLSGMRERAALLGGELVIESIPAKGTQVAAVLPIPATETGERS